VLQFSDRPPSVANDEPVPEVRTIEVPEIETVSVRRLPESWTGVSEEAPAPGGSSRVVMYSAQWCGVCKTARRYFQEHKIRYTEKDIERSKRARQEFERLGGRGVPLILVGRKRLSGFSAASFEKVYRR
jgi:glutaredoxin